MVKHGILAIGQWSKVRQHSPGMDVNWCAAHQAVGLFDHGSHIQVVTMVKKVLIKKETGEMRVKSLLTDWDFVQRRGKEKRRQGSYLKVLFLGAQKQRLAAAGDVGHAGHDQK